jgi:hypothetical protein
MLAVTMHLAPCTRTGGRRGPVHSESQQLGSSSSLKHRERASHGRPGGSCKTNRPALSDPQGVQRGKAGRRTATRVPNSFSPARCMDPECPCPRQLYPWCPPRTPPFSKLLSRCGRRPSSTHMHPILGHTKPSPPPTTQDPIFYGWRPPWVRTSPHRFS